jgi:hypothetical protein
MSFLKISVDGCEFKEAPINEDVVRFRVSETDYIEVSIDGEWLEIRSNASNVSRTKLVVTPVSGNVVKAGLVYS